MLCIKTTKYKNQTTHPKNKSKPAFNCTNSVDFEELKLYKITKFDTLIADRLKSVLLIGGCLARSSLRKGKKKMPFKVKDEDFKKSSYTHPGGIINRCVAVAIKTEGVAVRNSNDSTKNTVFTREE